MTFPTDRREGDPPKNEAPAHGATGAETFSVVGIKMGKNDSKGNRYIRQLVVRAYVYRATRARLIGGAA